MIGYSCFELSVLLTCVAVGVAGSRMGLLCRRCLLYPLITRRRLARHIAVTFQFCRLSHHPSLLVRYVPSAQK